MSRPPLLLSWAHEGGNVGDKAGGLLALPRAWVPPFAVLGTGLIRQVETGRAEQALAALEPKLRGEVEARLFRRAEHLLIRSDGPSEATQPGGGLSLACETSWKSLARGLECYREERGKLGQPIVQRAIEPGLLGVMSNARSRVVDPGDWLVEGILNLRQPHTRHLRPGRYGRSEGSLSASTSSELLRELRRACAHLSRGGRRYRCEWIWDGSRIWLVQADPIPNPKGDREAMAYLSRREGKTPAPRVQADASELRRQSRRFAKLRSRTLFAELNMPLVPLRAINAERWQALERPLKWLNELLAESPEPIVVRCDVARRSVPFLLPTSAPQRSAARLAAFIEKTRSELGEAGFENRDVLFLLSPLVAAVASALAVADAKTDSVRIDALWGFPDGLLNLPHDSFSVERGQISSREIRRKPACLLLEEGETRRARLAEPFDWEPTLRADEIRQLAKWGIALSAASGKPMGLMALCRIGGRRGFSACRPFHCWEANDGGSGVTRVSSLDVVTFRGRKDLRRKVKAGSTVRLELEEHLDRDIGFIEAVGDWAVKNKATLIFSGSLLGHTRAVLERSGAIVTTPEGFKFDWSPYRPAVVSTWAGVRRVRMVPSETTDGAPHSHDFRGVVDLSGVPSPQVAEADLPGQPAMVMDDPRLS